MKNTKLIIKIVLDIIMIILIVLEFSAQFTGYVDHEIIGIILTVLFITHNVLNRNWFANVFKGKYDFYRIIWTTINFLLIICMTTTIISSVPISRTVFDFINGVGNIEVRRVHTTFAYWSFVFMAIHLGFHFNMLKGLIKIKCNGKSVKTICGLFQILICIAGIRCFIRYNIWQQLIAYYTFSVWHEGTIIGFIFNYFLLMLTIATITHNLLKLRKNKEGSYGKNI